MEKKAFIISVLVIFSGCAALTEERFSPINLSETVVEAGDTVYVDYILSTSIGQVIDTSFRNVAEIWMLNLSHGFEPIALKVGDNRSIPALEEALLGMKKGEDKEFTVPPEKAYGERNESLVMIFERTTVFPLYEELSVESFKTIFQEEPILSGVYSLNYWNVTVTNMSGDMVTFFNDAKEGAMLTHRGLVNIKVGGDNVTLTLDPIVNNTISTLEGTGRIVSVGEETYTVDFNHPLAGESLLIFILVERVIKPGSALDEKVTLGDVEFLTSFEDARREALDAKKPIFIYAHAAWCGWCRKFEEDVLKDKEVVETLQKGFVRYALDVDVEGELAREYRVFGTPTMIFLHPEGNETTRIRGYVAADVFKENLKKIGGDDGL